MLISGSSAVGGDDCVVDVDSARACTEGAKMLVRECSSAESTPIKRSSSLALGGGAVSTSDGADFYTNQVHSFTVTNQLCLHHTHVV